MNVFQNLINVFDKMAMNYKKDPTNDDLIYLGKVLESNPLDTITLSYRFPIEPEQLSIIRHLTELHPSSVNIVIKKDFGNFNFLQSLPKLAGLSLCFFGMFDFDHLKSFCSLKRLRLSLLTNKHISLEKHKQFLEDIEVFVTSNTLKEKNFFINFKKLTDLSISYNQFDCNILKQLVCLKTMDMFLGKFINFNEIAQDNLSLKYFSLREVSNIDSIDFVSRFRNLEYLEVDGLKKLKKLPNFEFNERLLRIGIKMVNFENFENLMTAKNLEEILIENPQTFDHELYFLLKLKNLKLISLGNYTDRLNQYFEENGINTKQGISDYMRRLRYTYDL